MLIPFSLPWEFQPQVPTGPNPELDLCFLWNGRFPRLAYFPSIGAATGGSPATGARATPKGLSPDFAGAEDYRWNLPATVTNPAEAVLFALALADTVSGVELCALSQSNSGNNTPLFRLEHRGDDGGWTLQVRDDASGTLQLNWGGGNAVAGRLYWVVGVWRNANRTAELWVDGVLRNTASTVGYTTPTVTQTEVGSLVRGGAVQYWDGAIPLAGIARSARQAQRIATLTNPWEVFEPLRFDSLTGGAAPTFLAAWARNRNTTLVGGRLQA